MRITEAARRETRRRIVDAGRKLFSEKGFEATTTRDLAVEADIAAGTLFNYFSSKEALALELMLDCAREAHTELDARVGSTESLQEALFALVAAEIRHLRPCRPFVKAVLETALSPFAREAGESVGSNFRGRHLERVQALLRRHDADTVVQTSFLAMHLYWTLYIGVLAFWADDDSPNQQATLVALDQSTRLFVDWLRGAGAELETTTGDRKGDRHGTESQ